MGAADDSLTSILDGVDPLSDREYGPPYSAAQLARLAALPDAERQLLAIALDCGASETRRLGAVEALEQGGWTSWKSSPSASREIAAVLGRALAHDTSHNRWGLPGHFMGYLGRLLADLPTGVREALEPLLGDRRVLTIYGSEAATVQRSEQNTLGDLARYLLAEHERAAQEPARRP